MLLERPLDSSDPLVVDVGQPDGMGGFFNDPTKTIGQPFNLCMTDAGFVFVVGLLTDNVSLFNPQGGLLVEWDVTPGSIPRAVEYSLPLNTAFVYCCCRSPLPTTSARSS